jgi:hypothetical protein
MLCSHVVRVGEMTQMEQYEFFMGLKILTPVLQRQKENESCLSWVIAVLDSWDVFVPVPSKDSLVPMYFFLSMRVGSVPKNLDQHKHWSKRWTSPQHWDSLISKNPGGQKPLKTSSSSLFWCQIKAVGSPLWRVLLKPFVPSFSNHMLWLTPQQKRENLKMIWM